MNLIPKTSNKLTYNYYCTFSSQEIWGDKSQSKKDVVTIRSNLTSNFLFGENGVLAAHDEDIRGDILVLPDDGWDVPPGISHNEQNCGNFGSLIVDETKFPEFAHLNKFDRLKGLSDKIKAMGYAGMGLWVPANHFGEQYNECKEKFMADGAAFWTERAKMCAYADVKYLKVDWGFHGRDVDYRRQMTEIMQKYSPGTMMEHVIGIFDQPYDPSPETQESPEFKDFMQLGKRTFEISDFYRTYDVTRELSEATTLMRISKLTEVKAKANDDCKGIINVEDNPIIAAALGMSMGIMRHKNTPRYDHVKKAIIWQRLAPPVRFEYDKLHFSSELVCDSYHYNTDPDVWPHIGNGVINQYAPAVMSLNAPLASVEKTEDMVPFILSSKNPETGAYTIAAVEINFNNEKYIPLTNVSVCNASAESPIGLFGRFKSIEINFDEIIEGKTVYMQKLTDSEATDITDSVDICGKTLKIYGEKTYTDGIVIKLS